MTVRAQPSGDPGSGIRGWLAKSRQRYAPPQEHVPTGRAEMFNFLLSLYAVIIGIGLTRLLEGIAQVIQFRDTGAVYWLHLAWLPLVFLLYVLLWFGTWRYRATIIRHRFFQYCLSLLPPITTYLATALLLPGDISESFNGYEYYAMHRVWIFGLFALACTSFVLVGYSIGGDPISGLENVLRVLCLAGFVSLAIVPSAAWHGTVLVIMYAVMVGVGLNLSISTGRDDVEPRTRG